jgi:hypothetical protein
MAAALGRDDIADGAPANDIALVRASASRARRDRRVVAAGRNCWIMSPTAVNGR